MWNPIRSCTCCCFSTLALLVFVNDVRLTRFTQLVSERMEWLKLVRQTGCSMEMASPREGMPDTENSRLEWSTMPDDHSFCIYIPGDAGSYSQEVMDFINTSIYALALEQPSIHVLEIGGGIGWSTLFALAVDERVRVTVFEPLSWKRELLNASVVVNGWQERVDIVERAACDIERHEKPMCYCPDNRMAPWGAIKAKGKECAENNGTIVIGASVDRVIAGSPFGRVHVVKVTADGLEPYLLAGAREFLWHHKPSAILLSWVGYQIKASGWQRDPTEIFDAFFSIGNWSYEVAGNKMVEGYRQLKALMGCWRHKNCPFRSGGNVIMRDLSLLRFKKRGVQFVKLS